MSTYAYFLMVATFLNALMAGFLFAFSAVVMPGIRQLSDRDFLRSFQAIDRVIQSGQPLFMIMWLGSSIALIVAAALALLDPGVQSRLIISTAALASVFLVQLPTMTVNIPLNNEVQSLDCDSLDEDAASQARLSFESQWNRWNQVRTVVSVAILAALLLLLWRL
ncbi:anthrone oxygenase family protein [Adhaeretor mobilis]|uniref:DUF1772 domain-containing protein n=1 Tax=Adhaeretor mobilis TaxID=1930276 RepID=A0A517N2I9_9BACT|nr:DUF1772 domain-containing protein [Adhaeretor mobilis]QDT01343.1 hypothetical protein HG15A2_46850 [Adhaeretor mobilis]